MANSYEFRLTIEINQTPIELMAEFDDDSTLSFVEMTDFARDYLMEQDLGSLKSAVSGALEALGLQGEADKTFGHLEAEIMKIPGAKEVAKLLDAPVYLTDLEYRPGDQLVIGVLIEYTLDVTVLRVSRLGVKATIDLTEEEPSE